MWLRPHCTLKSYSTEFTLALIFLTLLDVCCFITKTEFTPENLAVLWLSPLWTRAIYFGLPLSPLRKQNILVPKNHFQLHPLSWFKSFPFCSPPIKLKIYLYFYIALCSYFFPCLLTLCSTQLFLNGALLFPHFNFPDFFHIILY